MGNNLIPEQRVDKNGRVVKRYVRQEALSASGKSIPSPVLISSIEGPYAAPETLDNIDTLVSSLYLHAKKLEDSEEPLSVEQLTPWMLELYSDETLAMGAELFRSPDSNNEMNEWFMRGLLETAEDAFTVEGITPDIRAVLPRVVTRVEQARVVIASNAFERPDLTLRRLLSRVTNQAVTGVQKAVRSGAQRDLPQDDDSDILRANVSLLMLNLVSPLTTRDVIESPEIYENLDRIYYEMDRILPYFPAFQRRGAFSFEVLEEMEQSTAPSMIDGIL